VYKKIFPLSSRQLAHLADIGYTPRPILHLLSHPAALHTTKERAARLREELPTHPQPSEWTIEMILEELT